MPPTVSVIVPVFNSEKFLRRCVEGLLQQTYERSAYEILLVDNNSTDRSRDVAREYRDVRLISEPRQGSYAARNRGVSVSSGEILAFTDADCVASPSWLAQLVKPFASPDVCIVQGRRKFGRESHLLSILANYEAARAAYTFSPPGKGSHYGYTNNMAVRRDVFEHCGPFRPIWRGADSLFVDRIITLFSHNAVRYAPDAAVQHLEMASVWTWWRKKTIYGRSYEHTVALRQSHEGLSRRQRTEIIRRAIQSGGYAGVQVLLLIFLAGVGATAFQFGRGAGACDLTWQRVRERLGANSIS
ncbi:MAG TPA: glycosyltransferase family A protein [Candidatus Binataceae bacterium]|nr:glycosyltransferase family A protein [Candidatus Binataceae bacterium]